MLHETLENTEQQSDANLVRGCERATQQRGVNWYCTDCPPRHISHSVRFTGCSAGGCPVRQAASSEQQKGARRMVFATVLAWFQLAAALDPSLPVGAEIDVL